MQTIIERNATLATAQPPKLMDRVRESLRAHRYALIPRFCSITGYTEKAVRRKMQSGVWLEGREWKRAPDAAAMSRSARSGLFMAGWPP